MRKLLSAVLTLICLIAVVAALYGVVVGSWVHAVIEAVVALISGVGSYVLGRSRTAPGKGPYPA